MAYVVRSNSNVQASASTSHVIALPVSVQNDVVFLFITTEGGSTVNSIVGNNGNTWTLQASTLTGDNSRVYTSPQGATPDTSVTVTFAATEQSSYFAVVVRGANTTTPVDVYAVDTTNTIDKSAASVTTTASNELILFLCNLGTGVNAFSKEGTYFLGNRRDASRTGICAAYTYKAATGATGTYKIFSCDSTARAGALYTIAVKDDGNGYITGYHDVATQAFTYLAFMNINEGPKGTGTYYDPTSVSFENITTMNNGSYSVSCVNVPNNSAADSSLEDGTASRSFSSSAGSIGNLFLGGLPITETYGSTDNYDLSGKLLICNYKLSNASFTTEKYIGSCIGISDQTNARFWQTCTKDSTPAGNSGLFPSIIDVDDATFVMDEFGTPNTASVGALVFGCEPTATFSSLYIAPVSFMGTLAIQGGCSTFPAGFNTCYDIAKTAMLNTILAQGGISDNQFFVAHNTACGGASVVYWDSSNQAAEWPGAYDADNGKRNFKIGASKLTHTIQAVAGSTVIYDSCTLNFGNYHNFVLDSAVDISAVGLNVLNAKVTLKNNGSAVLSGVTFSGCKEILYTTLVDLSGGNTITGCVDTQAITITSEANFAKLANCTFTNNNRAIKITGNQTHTGAGWADPNLTVSGNTYDIEYTGTTNFSIQSANSLSVLNSSTGTLTIVTPVTQLEVTSNIASSDIKIFETGTQTIEASGTGTSVTTTTAGTYDITVMKVGYLPQRQTGIVLGATSVTVAINLVADPVYNSAHGLTWAATSSPTAGQVHWARVTRRGYLADNQQGRNVYSALIAFWISQSALDNTEFPIVAVGPDRFDFTSDGTTAAQLDSGSVTYWKGAGMTWEHATTGNHTHRYCSIKSVGTLGGTVKVRYVQSEGGAINTATLVSGVVDQVVQYYSDTDGNGVADYNYSGHLVFKSFAIDYYQARNNVLSSFGISALEPYEYTIVLENVATGTASGTQSFTPVVTNQQASPVEEQTGYVFSFKVTEVSNSKTPEQFLAQWLYDTYTDPTTANLYGSALRAFDLPCPIVESGGSYSSIYQFVENTEDTTEKHGFYFAESGSYHPDFLQQQEDQDAGSGFFVTPVVAQISITNLPDDVGGNTRLHIYNVTTATVIYSGDPAGTSYTDTYTDGDVAYATGGDSIRIRFAHVNAGTSFEYGQTIVLATTDGITADADNFVSADSVYALNAINGSTITNFSADFVGDEIEIASDTDFTAAQAYAFYCYTLTDATGIVDFWEGVTANDVANYRINNATVNIYFNSPLGVTYTVKQTDAARIYRADDAYPVKDPTTSGYGVQINWKNVVYVQNVGGSSLTAGEQAQLTQAAQAATVNTKIGTPSVTVSDDIAALSNFDPSVDIVEGALTYEEVMRIMLAESAGKVVVTNGGNTVAFRDTADIKDRIVATVDNTGQRTTVTVDGS